MVARITKEQRVFLRATRHDVALWRSAAEEQGLALSEWLRRCATRGAWTLPPTADARLVPSRGVAEQ